MNRREFVRQMALGVVGLVGVLAAGGCAVARVSKAARDKSKGQPWKCTHCGYLTRSTEDLSNTRCPRCKRKKMIRITEEQLTEELKASGAPSER